MKNIIVDMPVIPKVKNMESRAGNDIANQFIIDGEKCEVFQSYRSIIAIKRYGKTPFIVLDADKWDYSTTTGKYRNIFLGEDKKTTQRKIDSGEYGLSDLNIN